MAVVVQNDNQTSGAYVYRPRTVPPTQPTDPGYLYYVLKDKGGYNPCIPGNNDYGLNPTGISALPNCVGYATGRFNEIIGEKNCRYLGSTAAKNFYDTFINCERGQTPRVGAVMCFRGVNSAHPYGHVAIVEEVVSPTYLIISQSGYNFKDRNFEVSIAKKMTHYAGYEDERGQWYIFWRGLTQWATVSTDYAFQGFIYNPAVLANGVHLGGAASYNESISYPGSEVSYEETVTRVSYNHKISTLDSGDGYTDVRGTNLLTYPSLVEAPYITVKIAGITFGSYVKGTKYEGNTRIENIQYPNFVNSLNVVKVNGSVNKYTIQLIYQVQAGEDPNFMEKVFGRSGYSNIYISYGDMQSPNFIYKEEEALITKVVSNVDFASSRITYTISATSNATKLSQNKHNFDRIINKKPSDIIFNLLKNNQYGLRDVFPGLYTGNKFNETLVRANSLIATDDCSCTIEAKTGIDVITYINYLVSCMTSLADKGKEIKDSYYFMTLRDDVHEEFGGAYFTVRKIDQSGIVQSFDTYTVDVGFPGETPVVNFSVQNDNLWSILYNYSDTMEQDDYIYKIDAGGNLYSEYAPNLTRNSQLFKTTESAKSWWTRMTRFPIQATLQIKGVVRPVMLMTYVKINAFFYGQRHIASGLYVVTKHVDDVSTGGYRTTLTLLRVAGDNDYISGIDYTVKTDSYTVTTTSGSTPSIVTTDNTPGTGGVAEPWGGGGGHGGGAGRPDTSATTPTNNKQKSNSLYDQTMMEINVMGSASRRKATTSAGTGGIVFDESTMSTVKTNPTSNGAGRREENKKKNITDKQNASTIGGPKDTEEMLKKLAMLDEYDGN